LKPKNLNPLALIILDGWGHCQEINGNAVKQAHTPNMDAYSSRYPHTLLQASGEAVGLPEGQMGNSEVGHLNIGAGRIVYQEITRIDKAISSGEFFENRVLKDAMERASSKGVALHLMGLVSDGGVHSHLQHLQALLEMAYNHKVKEVYIHAILDGRDVSPTSASEYLKELMDYVNNIGVGRIATVSGRYYAMDRDQRWERTAKAYRALVYGDGHQASDPLTAVNEAYRRGENDEFVIPTVITENEGKNKAEGRIGSQDSLILFNFRPDRVRQITRSLFEEDFDAFDRGENPVFPFMVTLTEYDEEFPLPIAFPPQYLLNTLGEWFSGLGYSQMRLAETEKYAHVTFFFNGGKEEPSPGEDRCLIPSPPVATYDLQPEMSAPQVGAKAREIITEGKYPLMVVNFANADMVGHTGIMEAAIKAVEAVDAEVGRTVNTALSKGYRVFIVADHGNAEKMYDEELKSPHTAHTSNPVPFYYLGGPAGVSLKEGGKLADIIPTMISAWGLEPPSEMTGENLLLETGETLSISSSTSST